MHSWATNKFHKRIKSLNRVWIALHVRSKHLYKYCHLSTVLTVSPDRDNPWFVPRQRIFALPPAVQAPKKQFVERPS